MPADLSDRFGLTEPSDRAEVALGGRLLLLLRLAQVEAVPIFRWRLPTVRRSIGPPWSPVFSPRVPLDVRLDADAASASSIESFRSELARASRSKGSGSLDLIPRTPSLSNQAQTLLDDWADITVAIGIESDDLAAHGLADSSLVVSVASDGGAITCSYDRAAIADDHARSMARAPRVLPHRSRRATLRFQSRSTLCSTTRPGRESSTDWNATRIGQRPIANVTSMFRRRSRRTPDAVAVTEGSCSLTYRRVGRPSRTSSAAVLAERGVGADVPGRSAHDAEAPRCSSPCLRSSRPVAPTCHSIPSFPADRIAYMIEDSGLSIVLSESSIAHELPSGAADIIHVDRELPPLEQPPIDLHDRRRPEPTDLAYVIYTSGSTGRPKGVMIEHRNVVNFFAGMDEHVGRDTPGRWLAVTSLSFDISVLELLWPLCRGFEVVLYGGVRAGQIEPSAHEPSPHELGRVELSLAFFASDGLEPEPDPYEFLKAAAVLRRRAGLPLAVDSGASLPCVRWALPEPGRDHCGHCRR